MLTTIIQPSSHCYWLIQNLKKSKYCLNIYHNSPHFFQVLFLSVEKITKAIAIKKASLTFWCINSHNHKWFLNNYNISQSFILRQCHLSYTSVQLIYYFMHQRVNRHHLAFRTIYYLVVCFDNISLLCPLTLCVVF